MNPELRAKETGMTLAAEGNSQWLEKAREVARNIALSGDGLCSIEGIRARWPYRVSFGNWAGSIFKDGNWDPEGIMPALHEGSHGRWVRVWRYKPKAWLAKNPVPVRQVASPATERQRPPAAATQGELFSLPQTPWD